MLPRLQFLENSLGWVLPPRWVTYLMARGLGFTLWLLYPPPRGSSVWLHECAHITVVPSRMSDLSRQENKETTCLWWSSHKSHAIVCSRIYASEMSYRSWTHAQGMRLGSHMFGGGVPKSVQIYLRAFKLKIQFCWRKRSRAERVICRSVAGWRSLVIRQRQRDWKGLTLSIGTRNHYRHVRHDSVS